MTTSILNSKEFFLAQKVAMKNSDPYTLSLSFPDLYIVAFFNFEGTKAKGIVGYESADKAKFYANQKNGIILKNNVSL